MMNISYCLTAVFSFILTGINASFIYPEPADIAKIANLTDHRLGLTNKCARNKQNEMELIIGYRDRPDLGSIGTKLPPQFTNLAKIKVLKTSAGGKGSERFRIMEMDKAGYSYKRYRLMETPNNKWTEVLKFWTPPCECIDTVRISASFKNKPYRELWDLSAEGGYEGHGWKPKYSFCAYLEKY